MGLLKSVKLVATRSVGRSITKGRTYTGYIVDDKYSIETNFGKMKHYSPKLFRIKE